MNARTRKMTAIPGSVRPDLSVSLPSHSQSKNRDCRKVTLFVLGIVLLLGALLASALVFTSLNCFNSIAAKSVIVGTTVLGGFFVLFSQYFRMYSSNATPLKKSSAKPITPLPKKLGNEWLTKCIRQMPSDECLNGDHDFAGCSSLWTSCDKKRCFDLAPLFPERNYSSADVNVWSVEELIKLPPVIFFAIVDLISGEKAVELLSKKEFHPSRKMALYYFNENFAHAFNSLQKSLYLEEVDFETIKETGKEVTSLKRYNCSEMEELMKKESYRELNRMRMEPSKTLMDKNPYHPNKEGQFSDRWEGLNGRHLRQGLSYPLTEEFILSLSKDLREPDGGEEWGFRKKGEEVSNPWKEKYYLPGSVVKSEMAEFLSWVNKGIKSCDKNEENPIVMAALLLQRFVSLHPLMDGNGRVGRFLSDLLLRRYGLLPAAWSSEGEAALSVFPFGIKENVTPTEAVQRMQRALLNSHRLIEKSSSIPN